jgi:negative regulator of genetic competence, sporulation and motility
MDNEGKSEKKPQRREAPQKKRAHEESCAITPKAEALPAQRRSTIGKMIFSFDSLRDMCDVCKILKNKKSGVESRAYKGAEEDYYLVIENANMSAYCRLDTLTFILEYGRRERADHINTYLSEHGKAICPDKAIETLAEF